jgi:hypothetical protein
MRNTMKYVLAISSAAVLTAGTLLVVSPKSAGAAVSCSNTTCDTQTSRCVRQGGEHCAELETGGCASSACR